MRRVFARFTDGRCAPRSAIGPSTVGPSTVGLAAIGLAAVLVVALASAGSAGPFPPPEVSYAADLTMQADGQTITGRVHGDRGIERREIRHPGGTEILLIDRATRTGLLLLPQEQAFVSLDFHEIEGAGMDQLQWTTTREGEDRVQGIRATRYRVEGRSPDGSRASGHAWVTPEGVVVRQDLLIDTQERNGRVSMTLTNLRVGPQDPSLFLPPEGWRAIAEEERDDTPGSPAQGQPQYGQPQYGQPQYGQPQYGQPGGYGQRPLGPPTPLGGPPNAQPTFRN